MAVEMQQPVQRPSGPSGLGGFFSRPIAGIPVWGWLGIIVVGVGVTWFFFWRKGAALGSSAMGSNGTADTSTAGGLAIDPSSGLPYATNGQGGLNPAGAFAGETTFNPLGDTNSLLQQILNQNQNNTNPPTSNPPTATTLPGYDPTSRYYTLPAPMTLDSVAALVSSYLNNKNVTTTGIYYNPANNQLQATLRQHGGISKGGTGSYQLPKGTRVYIAGATNTSVAA